MSSQAPRSAAKKTKSAKPKTGANIGEVPSSPATGPKGAAKPKPKTASAAKSKFVQSKVNHSNPTVTPISFWLRLKTLGATMSATL